MGAGASKAANEREQEALIFTYGTVKMGFPNHALLRDMLPSGEASPLGEYTTLEKFPLMCGPFKVPFLLNFPGSGHRVSGELYSVTPAALARIDEFSKGPYERLPVEVQPAKGNLSIVPKTAVVWAEAYFAHRSFAEEMLRKGGEFLGSYSKKEAAGYVKPADRPPHVSFMDQIRLFLSSPSFSSSSSSSSSSSFIRPGLRP